MPGNNTKLILSAHFKHETAFMWINTTTSFHNMGFPIARNVQQLNKQNKIWSFILYEEVPDLPYLHTWQLLTISDIYYIPSNSTNTVPTGAISVNNYPPCPQVQHNKQILLTQKSPHHGAMPKTNIVPRVRQLCAIHVTQATHKFLPTL